MQSRAEKRMTVMEEAGITCGNCKGKHPTVADVRACYNTGKPGRQDDVMPGQKQDGLSPGRKAYLHDLLKQFKLELDNGLTIDTIGYRRGQVILEALIKARRDKATGRNYVMPEGVKFLSHPDKGQPRERTTTTPKLPDVPAGHYAVPKELLGYTENDLYFYRVDKPDKGPLAGRTFIKSIIGGHPEYSRFSLKETINVLNAIVKFGIEDAGIVYAQELKRCWKCNTHLTRKASRVLSIGPECAEQAGRGEEWRALDAHFNHENAED